MGRGCVLQPPKCPPPSDKQEGRAWWRAATTSDPAHLPEGFRVGLLRGCPGDWLRFFSGWGQARTSLGGLRCVGSLLTLVLCLRGASPLRPALAPHSICPLNFGWAINCISQSLISLLAPQKTRGRLQVWTWASSLWSRRSLFFSDPYIACAHPHPLCMAQAEPPLCRGLLIPDHHHWAPGPASAQGGTHRCTEGTQASGLPAALVHTWPLWLAALEGPSGGCTGWGFRGEFREQWRPAWLAWTEQDGLRGLEG